MDNPALIAFIQHLPEELAFGQVLVRRSQGYELRHVRDVTMAASDLRKVSVSGLRALVQATAEGEFRPLKSAPTLVPGWICLAQTDAQLAEALDHLYPGALADWHAAQSPAPPVTHYRDFVNRQTGMYRISQMLSDEQVAVAVRSNCDARFCLKQRLWTVEGLAPDEVDGKSMIACLEPCALMLEFARKSMRLEQQDKHTIELGKDDLETLRAALSLALEAPAGSQREAEFGEPANPRRLLRLLEKLPAGQPELTKITS